MCLSLYDYQFTASRYKKALTYLKNQASTSQKLTIKPQKPKRRAHKHKKTRKTSNYRKKSKTKERQRTNWKTRFNMAMNICASIITLNVNGLNMPIKAHRVADWIKKKKPKVCCPQENHLQGKGQTQTGSGGTEKDIHANGNNKKAGATLFKSNKID